MAEKIESFRDLNVYTLAFELQQEVFSLSMGFPKEELYFLTDQSRRASPAIGANIAESWHKRRYPAHFISKLTDADAEQAETQQWLDTALACQYISARRHDVLLEKCRRVGRMLGKMMAQPESFCGDRNK